MWQFWMYITYLALDLAVDWRWVMDAYNMLDVHARNSMYNVQLAIAYVDLVAYPMVPLPLPALLGRSLDTPYPATGAAPTCLRASC